MSSRPPNPIIHEINTWVWLPDLGRLYRRPVKLVGEDLGY